MRTTWPAASASEVANLKKYRRITIITIIIIIIITFTITEV